MNLKEISLSSIEILDSTSENWILNLDQSKPHAEHPALGLSLTGRVNVKILLLQPRRSFLLPFRSKFTQFHYDYNAKRLKRCFNCTVSDLIKPENSR